MFSEMEVHEGLRCSSDLLHVHSFLSYWVRVREEP